MNTLLEHIPVVGFVELRKNGNLFYAGKNIVTTAGFNLIASRIKNTTPAAPGWIAMGDSNNVPTLAQTELEGTEIQRVAGTTTVVDNAFKIEASMGGLGVDHTIGEFGIFNAASAGTMITRFTTPLFSLFQSDVLDVSWTVYIGGT